MYMSHWLRIGNDICRQFYTYLCTIGTYLCRIVHNMHVIRSKVHILYLLGTVAPLIPKIIPVELDLTAWV